MIARFVGWWTRRRAAVVVTLVTAFAGGAISYNAQAAISRPANVPWVLSWLYPLGLDGMIVVASLAVLELRGVGKQIYVWTLLLAAIGFSVAANAAHAGAFRQIPPAVWSAVPAVAYAAALHVLVLMQRPEGGREQGTRAGEARMPKSARTRRARRRSEPPVVLDGRQVSAAHTRRLRARRHAMEAADAA
jgi:hypothetical protein